MAHNLYIQEKECTLVRLISLSFTSSWLCMS
jgi:hypothetical protein